MVAVDALAVVAAAYETEPQSCSCSAYSPEKRGRRKKILDRVV